MRKAKNYVNKKTIIAFTNTAYYNFSLDKEYPEGYRNCEEMQK